MSARRIQVAAALVVLFVAGFLVPYLLLRSGGGSGGLQTTSHQTDR